MDARITAAIFQAIDIVNQGRAPAQQIEKSLDTTLRGEDAQVDSLGLVNLIVAGRASSHSSRLRSVVARW